jgi:hypothetical protein
MIELPIYGGFYESDSLPISAQQLINYHVNRPQTQGALAQQSIFGSAGLTQIQTSGITPNEINRGSHVKDGVPYFLNGQTLQRLDISIDVDGNDVFTLTNLGAITGSNRASFASNGTQLMIVTDNKGWIVNEAAIPIFQEITAAGFTANGLPQTVAYSDSFFTVTTDSKLWIKSAANNGLSWNSLDRGSAEADPDDIVGQIVFKRQVYIAGSETFEVFENRGLGGFPFQRNGLIINKGLSSKFAIVETTQGIMFLGAGVNETAAIWLISGNDVQKVSTTAIDSVLNSYSQDDIESSFAMSYGQAGAYFVVFTFAKDTFEYNTITQKWNQRESRITNANGLIENRRWRANSMVSAYNRIICGDSVDGRIGVVSRDVYSEYEDAIIRTLVTMPFSNGGNSFSVSTLEMTVESGVGDVEAPEMRLSTSTDAKTFGNERPRTFGKTGEYHKRMVWSKNGRAARFLVLKFVVSDKVKPVIIKLEAVIKAGNGK